MPCAPAAIRRCAPRPSASTSSACIGSPSPSPAAPRGIAGGLFAFAKGSISPETINVGRSIDGIVMVLLGGIESLSGPIVGAGLFTVLQDTAMRQTEYWRALLGVIILILVLVFPGGIIGALSARFARRRTP